jgi:hypothetical protein
VALLSSRPLCRSCHCSRRRAAAATAAAASSDADAATAAAAAAAAAATATASVKPPSARCVYLCLLIACAQIARSESSRVEVSG